MSFSDRAIEQKMLDVNVARAGTVVFEVVTGIVGGLTVKAIAEHKPVKATLLGVASAGLGYLAFRAGNVHEEYAQELGMLEAQP